MSPRIDKIICIGKNYDEHARELGDAVPESPVIFLKPPSVLREAGMGERIQLHFPRDSGALHHEVEIVLRLKEGGSNFSPEQAARAVDAVTVGLDMTLRDRQGALKKAGHPWEISKVFPDSAVVGLWTPLAQFADYLSTPFSFELDGSVKQKDVGSKMLFDPIRCLTYASRCFPLCAGDLLFTGTPKGVGPVSPGSIARIAFGKIAFEATWNT